MPQPIRSFWVTGTDTDVGKTLACAMLQVGTKGSYWKPIQSGTIEGTDTETMIRLTDMDRTHFIPEVYRLTQPLSPHRAAEIDGVTIRLDSFHRPDTRLIKNQTLIIEGAGGILVPINSDEYIIDLMKTVVAPVILVCRSTLGTINHTLMSIEILRNHGLTIHGFIINGPENISNRDAIVHYGEIRHLASIPVLTKVNSAVLYNLWIENRLEEKLMY